MDNMDMSPSQHISCLWRPWPMKAHLPRCSLCCSKMPQCLGANKDESPGGDQPWHGAKDSKGTDTLDKSRRHEISTLCFWVFVSKVTHYGLFKTPCIKILKMFDVHARTGVCKFMKFQGKIGRSSDLRSFIHPWLRLFFPSYLFANNLQFKMWFVA